MISSICIDGMTAPDICDGIFLMPAGKEPADERA